MSASKRVPVLATLLVILVTISVCSEHLCTEGYCTRDGSDMLPSASKSTWTIPFKTLVEAVIKAANKGTEAAGTVGGWGALVPDVGYTRRGSSEALLDVAECDNCCGGDTPRLLTIPMAWTTGNVTRTDGPLVLPGQQASILAVGPASPDAHDLSETLRPTIHDDDPLPGSVTYMFVLDGGGTEVSLSFLLGLLEFDIWKKKTEDDIVKEIHALDDAEIVIEEDSVPRVEAYCGCIPELASISDLETAITTAINLPPVPAFQDIITISLDGTDRSAQALTGTDPEGAPVWVFLDYPSAADAGCPQFSVDPRRGHVEVSCRDLTSDEIESLAGETIRPNVWLYDLKPGEVVRGSEPEEYQYYNAVRKRVTIQFVASQPPTVKDVEETMTTIQFREAGCNVKAQFEAIDDDPHGVANGYPISFEIDYSRTSPELQMMTAELYPICGSDGICRASATFRSLDRPPCLLPTQEISLPIGSYQVGFLVHEHREDGVAIFVHKGTYTLHIVSTPPTAVDDAFDMVTNAAGASQSVVCNVLANDSDIDGDELIAARIVDKPAHGNAVVEVTGDERLVIRYTSNEGHGGIDTFTYRVSDVPGASTEIDGDWSNKATVTVRTATPPVVVDLEVMGRPDLDTVAEGYEGPWIMNFEASALLLLSAVDLDAKSHEGYEFRVSPQPNGAPGVTMESFGGVMTVGRLTCEQPSCVYDGGERRITMTGTATIKGPQVLLPEAGYLGMRFSVTAVDPDGHVSEPGVLTVMISNAPPQGEAIQSRYISFCFGEPMIYPLEPSWYEAGCLSFTDPDGDPLTFRISQQPRKGRADLMKSGGGGAYEVTVMYHIDHDDAMLDHTDDVPFVDYLTVEAKDPFGATAETVLEITVDVINSDPVCVDDEVTTPMNTAVEVGVLGNDSDVDGDELTVIAVGVAGNGVASSVSDNTIRYVPNNGFYGDDTFSYTAEDGYGGLDEATVAVHVVDTEPPVFVRGPSDVGPLFNIAGTCGAAGKWTPPVSGVDVTDNIGLASLTCTHASGDVFPVGVTTVTHTATDLSGNTTNHTFTVSVVDDELPTIDGMPSDICVEVPVGTTETTVSWIEPTASDNCGIASLVSTTAPGAVFPLGKTSVVYTATDIHGNTVTDSLGVTVAEAWQLACSNKYVATSNPSGTTVSFADPVIGGCGVTTIFDPVSGSFFNIGDTDVLCEVTDGVRTETCTFTVTVEFVNHDPVANGDVVDLKDSEIATEIDVLKNDSDADGDDLTIIDVSTPSPCGEVWIDADGQSVWFIGLYCQPYLGGTATFTYTISDGNGGEDTATVSVDLPDSGTMPEVAEPPKDGR